MKSNLARVSKRLSYVLRHKPESIGITLDADGWVETKVLLAALASNGQRVSAELLERVVVENDKQRFAFSADGSMIRASQGHSTKVDLGLAAVTPPRELFHGTAIRNLVAIEREGLKSGQRQHVHLSADLDVARNVGMRHGKPVVLVVDARAMHDAGHRFYCSDNGVSLTDAVPCEFVSRDDAMLT